MSWQVLSLQVQIFPHFCVFPNITSKKFKLDQINVNGYGLGASYCRQVVKKSGVCIFVHKNLTYTTIDLGKYYKDQDIVVCALKLESTSFNAYIMAVHRAPTDNVNLFLNRLDGIIKHFIKLTQTFYMWGHKHRLSYRQW